MRVDLNAVSTLCSAVEGSEEGFHGGGQGVLGVIAEEEVSGEGPGAGGGGGGGGGQPQEEGEGGRDGRGIQRIQNKYSIDLIAVITYLIISAAAVAVIVRNSTTTAADAAMGCANMME